jgi:hypothetical protein
MTMSHGRCQRRAKFRQAITIRNQPAIPISDADTPPNTQAPLPSKTHAEKRIQAIACTAAFHFAYIGEGGSSLYATRAEKVTNLEVLRIVGSEKARRCTSPPGRTTPATPPPIRSPRSPIR